MDLVPFSALTSGQLTETVAIYREAFEAPWEWPAERIAGLVNDDDASALACVLVEGDATIGFAIANYLSAANLVYLRYLAVAPARRSAGAGAILLSAIRAASEERAHVQGQPGCRGMLAEIELVAGPPPAADRGVRQRRLAFYQRQGALSTGVCVPRPPWAPPEMPEWEIMLLPGAAWAGKLDRAASRELALALMIQGYEFPADTPWLQAWAASH